MPVDLTYSNWFSRVGMLIEDDHLLLLEYRFSTDRLRRIPFEHVRSVAVWRSVPIWPILLIALILLLPASLILLTGEPGLDIVAGILAIVGFTFIGYLVYVGRTTVQITLDGRQRRFSLMVHPGKLDRFLDRLVQRIHAVQANKRLSAANRLDAQATTPQPL